MPPLLYSHGTSSLVQLDWAAPGCLACRWPDYRLRAFVRAPVASIKGRTMTSLDFQSLLKQEKKALRRAERARRQPPQNQNLQPAVGAASSATTAVQKVTKQGSETDTSPWFVELAERPLLEMTKVEVPCFFFICWKSLDVFSCFLLVFRNLRYSFAAPVRALRWDDVSGRGSSTEESWSKFFSDQCTGLLAGSTHSGHISSKLAPLSQG